jgi:S1-C subfamily serine protease
LSRLDQLEKQQEREAQNQHRDIRRHRCFLRFVDRLRRQRIARSASQLKSIIAGLRAQSNGIAKSIATAYHLASAKPPRVTADMGSLVREVLPGRAVARRWIFRAVAAAVVMFWPSLLYATNHVGAPRPGQVSADDASETLAELMAHARDGNAEEQNRLGLLFLAGKYVNRNPQEGIKWIRSAAERGLAAAQFNLAVVYERGADAPKDLAEAAKWFHAAADQGYAQAQEQLGLLYEHGLGLPQNYDEAITWLRRAADQNDDAARFGLSQMYERGEGTAKDMAEAMSLLGAAAGNGFPPAQIVIAGHYLSGVGVARDPVYAYFWSAVGAAHAPDNFAAFAATVRDKAAQLLDANQIAALQSAAADWRPGTDPASVIGAQPAAAPAAGAPPAVVQGQGITGTGFVVASDGYVVTNAHVVPGCASVTVRSAGDTAMRSATLVDRDPRADLALLRAEGAFADVASFRDGPGIAQGDDVIAFGYPLAGLLSDQGNLTIGTVSALAGINNDAQMIQISAPIQHGNSGGPVIDTSGNVVGVIVSKIDHAQGPDDVAQNVNFAIKADVARHFLAANGLTYRSAESLDQLKRAELVARIKAFTVQIACNR